MTATVEVWVVEAGRELRVFDTATEARSWVGSLPLAWRKTAKVWDLCARG